MIINITVEKGNTVPHFPFFHLTKTHGIGKMIIRNNTNCPLRSIMYLYMRININKGACY